MLSCYIRAIEYYLPDTIEINDIEDASTQKIGIKERHIASKNEYASHLAIKASNNLLKTGIKKEEIDYRYL